MDLSLWGPLDLGALAKALEIPEDERESIAADFSSAHSQRSIPDDEASAAPPAPQSTPEKIRVPRSPKHVEQHSSPTGIMLDN